MTEGDKQKDLKSTYILKLKIYWDLKKKKKNEPLPS